MRLTGFLRHFVGAVDLPHENLVSFVSLSRKPRSRDDRPVQPITDLVLSRYDTIDSLNSIGPRYSLQIQADWTHISSCCYFLRRHFDCKHFHVSILYGEATRSSPSTFRS